MGFLEENGVAQELFEVELARFNNETKVIMMRTDAPRPVKLAQWTQPSGWEVMAAWADLGAQVDGAGESRAGRGCGFPQEISTVTRKLGTLRTCRRGDEGKKYI